MRNYCTLADKTYLPKLLAMYESLKRHSSEEFRLSILAMDEQTEDCLEAMKLPGIIVLGRRAFEHDQQLSNCKMNRTWQEYCWTCASNLCEWLLLCPDCELPEVTYLDADLFFFSDPKVVHEEIGERSIGIIPHRLIPSKRHLEVNGKFNVGWVTFKNTPAGRECLSSWAMQVRERCVASTCGDQLYLDEWPDRYGDEVCIVQSIGANLAPWNLANYHLTKSKDTPVVYEGEGVVTVQEVIFYHFHEFAEVEQDGFRNIRLTNYELRPEDRELIYAPYLKAYEQAKAQIENLRLQQPG